MSDKSNITKDFALVQLEDYLPLAEAAKRMPRGTNGRKVHVSTIWRWCRRGCRGIKLRYYRVGRTIMVTETTLQQFFSALAKVDAEQADSNNYKPRPKRSRPGNRQASIDQANDVLRNAGILV